ncbi:N-acetylmuramate alpha-1-phosphate uridylyltransferase MurU [Marinospirillum alkaliphilum]|uniref:Nucleotidyl transferase n=1 Tax=Marinospirillum alkaliphilum DSM 21637 TaxID=1122209 RepID=A0A1K1VGZ8_9GAMM|nr:nucleotidyltransferase family protein [Marinospirillum alkaliphilum]SFX24449.1 Nucleotidyl transferase [Marinospirillum alkaliphilum DSM 21637]
MIAPPTPDASMIKQCMIFAAGLGQRMLPLTQHTPKPLLKVAGKPLLFWHLERLSRLGIQRAVINISHLGHQIREAVGDGSAWQLKVLFSEENTPLETGGGLLKALPLLHPEPFLLLNADVWCEQLPKLNALRPEKMAHLLLVANPEHHPQGDFYLAPDGHLQDNADEQHQCLTFAGLSLLRPEAFQRELLMAAFGQHFQAGDAFPLAPLLRQLIRQNLASGEMLPGQWVDVGTPQRLQELDIELMNRQHRTPLA